MSEAARSAPIATLKTRNARSDRSARWSAADWASAPLDPSWRNAPAALAQISHDFGLIHWKTTAPPKPTGRSPAAHAACDALWKLERD